VRVDAHQHFWRYDPGEYGWIDDSMRALRRDFLPADLKPLLDAGGFDACVTVQARQTLEETTWLLDLADANPFIAGVVGWVDLRSPDVERDLAKLAARRKLVGVRHIVQAEPDDFLLRPDFLRGVALLERFGLAYDILIYPRHLPAALAFARRFPRQRFVLDHMAKPEIRAGALDSWRADLGELSRLPNVFCKVSGLVTEADWATDQHGATRMATDQHGATRMATDQHGATRMATDQHGSTRIDQHGSTRIAEDQLIPYLDVAFECFGPERLMIGSDWPVCTLAAPYAWTMTVVIDYLVRYSDAEREAVLGGTASRFWNLTRT
jgi:L-fuconolactonase